MALAAAEQQATDSARADQHRTIYAQALTNKLDPPATQLAMDEAAGRELADLLGISEDQLPPNTAELREELAQLLASWHERRDTKTSGTDLD